MAHATVGRSGRPAPRGSLIAMLLVVVAVLSFTGGVLVGRADEDAAPSLAPSPTVTAAPVEPTASPSPTGEPAADLPDGRYFVAPVEVTDDAPRRLVFDLASLLRGREAVQAAADHGDPLPEPPDEIYILNDTATLRSMPVSPSVVVEYIPTSVGGDQLQPGLFDPWAAAVNGELQTDYAGRDAWWWVTLQSGQIVRIEQQFLP